MMFAISSFGEEVQQDSVWLAVAAAVGALLVKWIPQLMPILRRIFNIPEPSPEPTPQPQPTPAPEPDRPILTLLINLAKKLLGILVLADGKEDTVTAEDEAAYAALAAKVKERPAHLKRLKELLG